MANVNPSTLPLIKKAPKALLGFARLHNDLVQAVRPMLDIRGGLKIGITQTTASTIISYLG